MTANNEPKLFSEDIILENDSVLLRPLQEDDFQHLEHFVIEEPEIWKYSLMEISKPQDLKEYIRQAVENRKLEKEYPFIVFDKNKKQYAGSTRFYDIQLAYKYLQLGYTWYGKNFQGTYLNKNCKLLLLTFAFEKIGMERVEFRADNRNERSKKAMQSIGCVVEGISRNHLPTPEGGRRDSIILSIIKEEWFDSVKKNLLLKTNNNSIL
ncbi:MAG: GNAT family N-acetyltransferase [Chitinophagales bacterium]|nr:GNAT family N-acetyltransferase [Chitinophagales bacterium]